MLHRWIRFCMKRTCASHSSRLYAAEGHVSSFSRQKSTPLNNHTRFEILELGLARIKPMQPIAFAQVRLILLYCQQRAFEDPSHKVIHRRLGFSSFCTVWAQVHYLWSHWIAFRATNVTNAQSETGDKRIARGPIARYTVCLYICYLCGTVLSSG